MHFLDIYEELSDLNEVKAIKNFTDGSATQFYHFYEDLADLVNSLKTKRIYSNKNAQASQLDVYAPEDSAYVCMTVGQEGKTRTAQNFGSRSFGLAFKDLDELCTRSKYHFNSSESGKYSQFLAKTQYNKGERGKPTATGSSDLVTAFRDFELLAIGQLDSGEYFISGGQGRNLNNHWNSKTFTDERIYKTLRAWFMTNMDGKQLDNKADTAQPHIYYHFVDNNIGSPRKDHPEDIYINSTGKHILNTDAQKNDLYIPRPDENKPDTSYDRAMDFTLKRVDGVGFKEIIGVGPFRVTDSTGRVVLQMDMCKPGSKGGYQPPKVFSTLAGSQEYSKIDDYTPGQSRKLTTNPKLTSRPNHLLLSKDTAEFIAELYNESEHRVYIPNKEDLAFKAADIETIVLPAKIEALGQRTYDIQKLLQAVTYGTLPTYNSKESFLDALKVAGVVGSKVRDVTTLVYNNITMLIQLLTTEYDHVLVELIDLDGKAITTLSLDTQYAADGGIDRLEKTDKGYKNNNARMRYIPEDDIVDFNILTQIQQVEEVKWDGVTSIIASLKDLGGVDGKARLGAETIVIGKDSAGEKYVLFVDNAHKAKGFLELPGGGLHSTQVTAQSFSSIAMQRLHFKGGIEAKYISNFTDTGKGLLLAEKGTDGTKGVAKTDKITWPWSYYKLFTANYTKEIDTDHTDYQFNNAGLEIETADGAYNYTCYLKWIPVSSLDYNRALISRYSNIFDLIRKTASKY